MTEAPSATTVSAFEIAAIYARCSVDELRADARELGLDPVDLSFAAARFLALELLARPKCPVRN